MLGLNGKAEEKRTPRLGRWCAFLIGCVLATAATGIVARAHATPSSSPVIVSNFGEELVVVGHGHADDVAISYEAGEYVVESPSGATSSTCTTESATRVSCYDFGPNLNVGLADGNDTVDLKTKSVFGRSVHGNNGNDTLLGSGAANVLYGDRGRDVIRAGRGNDILGGDRGVDSLSGQRGNDTIYAHDGKRDKVINCGPGRHDTAYVDRGLDPKPIGCERVIYKMQGRPGRT